MATFTAKYNEECMASLKSESKHKFSSPHDYTKQATDRAK